MYLAITYIINIMRKMENFIKICRVEKYGKITGLDVKCQEDIL